MGILESQIKEIREIQREYMAGKITSKQLNDRMLCINSSLKHVNTMVAIQALTIKARSQKPMKALTEQNVIGGKAAIDMTLEEREVETVRCPIDDSLITRAFCLDYSGGHMEECEKCQHFGRTRELLVDTNGVFIKG